MRAKKGDRKRCTVRSSLQSLHEAERVRRREFSAHSPNVSADATSEWRENGAQSPSVRADATSEWGERTAHRVPASVLTQRQSGEFPVECAERGRSGEATKHSSGIARAGTGEQRTGETRGREATEEKSN